jgi:mRNA-degrading endonuclease RelE of RelBE toxin-antitoxin system
MAPYALRVARSAQRSLQAMPEAAAAAVVEFMVGDLVADPQQCGGRLHRELAGYLAARRGPYRIIYRADDAYHVVEVARIDHRARVYRPR